MNTITEETRRVSFYSTNTKATKMDVMAALANGNKTAREVADFTKKPLNDVRSRITEEKNLGKIEACGKKKRVQEQLQYFGLRRWDNGRQKILLA